MHCDKPTEGAWTNMKNGLGNLAVRDVDQLAAIMKNRLKRIQYRPAFIEAFLAHSGLTFDSQPPQEGRYECWPFNFCSKTDTTPETGHSDNK